MNENTTTSYKQFTFLDENRQQVRKGISRVTRQNNCSDCGAEAGQPHNNDCLSQPCSVCGEQWINCNCDGHDAVVVETNSEGATFERKTKPSLEGILADLPTGSISDPSGVVGPLAEHWHRLNGSGDGGMQAHKLHGRMEDVSWNPPILRFVIERHGGTVCGSTRAELQHWEVDLDNSSARIVKTGHRQIVAMAPRISIKEIANEIVEAILSGRDDDRVQRFDDDKARVVASRIFPDGSAFKRTLLGRRKKLLEYLDEKFRDYGWRRSGANEFVRVNDETVADVVGKR